MLKTVCKVNVCTSGIVRLINSMLDRLNDNLSRMNADTDLQIRVADAGHGILHRKGCEAATNGVILVGVRGTKDCHDAIALGFVDDPIIANDGLVHQLKNGLQTPHSQLRISQPIDKTCRVADVGKQNGEALTLSALGMKRSQDLLPRLVGGGGGGPIQS